MGPDPKDFYTEILCLWEQHALLYISVSQLLHSTQKSVWSRVKAQRLKPGGKLKMPDWKLSPFMEESFRPQVTAATLNITLRARSLSPEEKEGSVEVLSRASLETLTLPTSLKIWGWRLAFLPAMEGAARWLPHYKRTGGWGAAEWFSPPPFTWRPISLSTRSMWEDLQLVVDKPLLKKGSRTSPQMSNFVVLQPLVHGTEEKRHAYSLWSVMSQKAFHHP